MDLNEALEITKVITYDVMAQYEEIRRLGPCNMFDYNGVMEAAEMMDFYNLADLTKDEYVLILQNFNSLMKYYGIEQE